MDIVFSTVNGRIVRACRKSDSALAGFGDTKEEAIAQLLEREFARAEELRVLENKIRFLFGKEPIEITVH